MDEFKVGDKVVFISKEQHDKNSLFYPPEGTIGTVFKKDDDGTYWVTWPEGTTLKCRGHYPENTWNIHAKYIKRVQNNAIFKVGDKVRAISNAVHRGSPEFYPPVGTIGTVISVNTWEQDDSIVSLDIKWPSGTTSRDDVWLCSSNYVELVGDEDNIDNSIQEIAKLTHNFYSSLVDAGFSKFEALSLTGGMLGNMISEAGKTNNKEEDK